jgi:D-tyrosyl-tRNA(Tyr) deacylase
MFEICESAFPKFLIKNRKIMSAPAAAATAAINPAIRMVLQRVNTASLLVDNISRRVHLKNNGIICHIAMFEGVNETHIVKAVKLITEAKLYTFESAAVTQKEKDENNTEQQQTVRAKPTSLVEDPTISLMIIPQASIAGRVKGKTAQYHAQAKKETGQELYNLFVSSLRKVLLPTEILDKLDGNGEMVLAKEEEGKSEKAALVGFSRSVLNGTYGNTQSLSFDSQGPMTHVLDIDL